MRSNIIDLELWRHHETEKAILVSDDGEREKAVWLPKSAVEVEEKGNSIVIVTLPEPLAIEKGLV